MKKESLSETFKSCVLTPGQSLHEVIMLVARSVSQSYEECQASISSIRKVFVEETSQTVYQSLPGTSVEAN